MIGKKLANRYEILERIGGGGMAIVYRALDTVLNRYVSVKVLRSQFVADEEFVHRFRREAQSAASLSHPNVVNIFDVGVEDETYFIVMEYINGKTLKEIIQERAPLPVIEAIDITKQICSALQHAHEHQIVHRDIKPHNIMIGKDGHVKVTDFGIARAVTSNTITHNGSVLGSVHYFSPEQARGAITDVKSDIYSLGVVLYEMLTGELPFSGETPISVALKHLQEHFVEPRQINPKIPQSVENIILKSLAKNPEVRYQSAREMTYDLDRALQNPDVSKFVPPDNTANTQPTIQIPAAALKENAMASGSDPKNSEKKPKSKKRKMWKIIGIIAGLLALSAAGVVGGFAFMNSALGGTEVDMPKVEGMTYEQAVNELKQFGFKEKNIKRVDEKDPGTPDRPPMDNGYVFSQDPESNKKVKNNRIVTLNVSTGRDRILMPNLENMTEDDAKKALTDLHWDLNSVKFINENRKDKEKGKVFDQRPPAQVELIPGQTKVEVYISEGPEMGKVPDVRNKSSQEAIDAIQKAGFQVGINDEYSYTVPEGQVTRQDQEPNKELEKNTKVNIWLSKGMPSDVKVVPFKVIETPDQGATVTITIVTTDSRGQKTIVKDEKISAPKEYPVELYLAPNTSGVIEVYENGKLKDKKVVPYS